MSGTKRQLAAAAPQGSLKRSTAARRRLERDLRTPEKILGEQLSNIRARQGWTAEQFADRVVELGGPRLDRATISRIEGGHRGVSLDEALILAAALGVAPVNLFVPMADTTYPAPVQLTRAIQVGAQEFRNWVRGNSQLRGLDDKLFRTEVADSEWEEQNTAYDLAIERVESTRRRWRFLKAKARQISVDLAHADTMYAAGLATKQADVSEYAERKRLYARLEVCYDEVAEAAVELEDAVEALRTQWPRGRPARSTRSPQRLGRAKQELAKAESLAAETQAQIDSFSKEREHANQPIHDDEIAYAMKDLWEYKSTAAIARQVIQLEDPENTDDAG